MALGTRGVAAAKARLGRYELCAELHRSPLGVLWLARADGARSVVALRRVVDRAPFGPADREAVAEVARWARELDHTTLVPIIEIETEGDELGIVQEHVEGESLRNLLRSAALEHAPLPVPVVLRIALDVLDGLEHLRAHRLTIPRGSVFGGLTPETVLVGADGRTRLVEPGVSGLCGGLAEEGSAGATPGLEALGRDPKRAVYHAPERFEGHELEVRADVFVVGALLWEMLRNRALFQGATYDAVAQRVLAGDVQRVDALAPPGGKAAPGRVADAVARALARAVEERPSPGELAEALRATGEATATAADVKACVEALCADALDKQRALAASASGRAPVSTKEPAERPRAVPPRAGGLPRPGGPAVVPRAAPVAPAPPAGAPAGPARAASAPKPAGPAPAAPRREPPPPPRGRAAGAPAGGHAAPAPGGPVVPPHAEAGAGASEEHDAPDTEVPAASADGADDPGRISEPVLTPSALSDALRSGHAQEDFGALSASVAATLPEPAAGTRTRSRGAGTGAPSQSASDTVRDDARPTGGAPVVAGEAASAAAAAPAAAAPAVAEPAGARGAAPTAGAPGVQAGPVKAPQPVESPPSSNIRSARSVSVEPPRRTSRRALWLALVAALAAGIAAVVVVSALRGGGGPSAEGTSSSAVVAVGEPSRAPDAPSSTPSAPSASAATTSASAEPATSASASAVALAPPPRPSGPKSWPPPPAPKPTAKPPQKYTPKGI